MPTLILTPRFTEDSQALWRAAGQLERLKTWRVPEELANVAEPVQYLEALFGPTLAEQFGLRLLEPPLDWLPRLPIEYRRRDIRSIAGRSEIAGGICIYQTPQRQEFSGRRSHRRDTSERVSR